MIKYIGSKRVLMPVIEKLASASGAETALDLFTGTTRVARALKSTGMHVTASDSASYSRIFAQTWISLDRTQVNLAELDEALAELNALEGSAGYFTQKFCIEARYFQVGNGGRIDAIRERIESAYSGSWLYEPLLTSLILAADRVDSTTGLQMAYLKTYAARSFRPLELRDPGLMVGTGAALQGDAIELSATLPEFDLVYLDPPYNQHRYFSNYHIWESLVRWDKPETYGVANKRLDARDAAMKSPFNSRLTMADALRKTVSQLKAKTMMLSYNNEAWLSRAELFDIASQIGEVRILDFDSRRYVGSQIGGFNLQGRRVSDPGHKKNIEHIVLAGEPETLDRMQAALS